MIRKFWLLMLVMSFLTACAHRPVHTSDAVESFRVSDPEPPKVVDRELETIPTDVNEKVEQWLRYFQSSRGRPHMERYLARSTRYMKLMKNILKQNGLPEDLIYIALIESGFSSRATSRAAAVGYWQFIRGTGKRYGLEQNAFVDERRDPVLSTQAAAEYFKGLYSVFGSWYLAMASYNVGENRVKKEVMNHYTRDFWELARKRRFPKETINYIPKFIAAKMIGNDPEKYGFTDIQYEAPLEFEHVKVEKPINLRTMAAKMGMEYETLKTLNPKFKGEIAPLKGSTLELRVPLGQTQIAMNAAQESFVDKVEYVADAGETETYKVRSGDSLYLIARKYRTTVAFLRDLNDINPGRKLRIGMRLQVPDRYTSRKVAKVIAKAKQKPIFKTDAEKAVNTEIKTADGTFYVVQAGDTLSAIADDYDSSVNELRKMNKMGNRSFLRVGMKLKVPKDEGLPAVPEGAPLGNSIQSVAKKNEAAIVDVVIHLVKRGENLYSIAKKYGVTLQALQAANNFSRKSILKVGTKLMIPLERKPSSAKAGAVRNLKPQKKVHVVRVGENLSVIADKYSVSVREILVNNRIKQGSKLFVGSKLMIPAAQASNR